MISFIRQQINLIMNHESDNFCIMCLFLLNADIQAQDMGTDTIQKLFLEQISLYPQEKIHVQTDKPSYISGDTIWLRAHLVDALLLKQANASRYVYVELINLLAEVVDRVMLRSDSLGCFYGYVFG